MEVLMVRPVKLIQAIKNVLGGVAVDHIKENNNAHFMCRVDQLFEILGWAVSTTGGKEVVDLVAEAGVVGMFHDGHQLDSVEPEVLYPLEHVPREFLVSADAELGRRDADMGLVDTKALGLRGPRVLELVFFGRRWIPK